jgi:N-acetylglucosaminyl-diphospho-decaprenol L-rhamnosyltransferase
MLDIIIVNRNNTAQSTELVQKLLCDLPKDFKIIMVDDNSIDVGSLSKIKDTRFAFIETNLRCGFGKACNLGVERGTNPYLLFLNSDAFISVDNMKVAIEMLKTDINISLLGPATYDDEGNIRSDSSFFPTFTNQFYDNIGLPTGVFSLKYTAFKNIYFNYAESGWVDQVIGAIAFCKRADFEAVSGFDEKFFVYFEDLDLAVKMRNLLGKRCLYSVRVIGTHSANQTSKSVLAESLFLRAKSSTVYFNKHFNMLPTIFLTLVVYLMRFPIRILASLLQLNFRSAVSNFYAWAALIVNIVPRIFSGPRNNFPMEGRK